MNNGKIVVLSGPSGVGKGTVVKYLLENDSNLVLSVSATTRKPREGEIEGVHYFFITCEEFERKIHAGEMLEYTKYNGNYYGTIKSYVREQQKKGKNVLLEIEVDGATQIKQIFPDAITIFMTAPSLSEVEHRLRERGTEDEETIKKRLLIAREEMAQAADHDYVVCNDTVENAANKIIQIIKSK